MGRKHSCKTLYQVTLEISMKILIVVRYGDIKMIDDKAADVLEFAKRFSSVYAPKLLEAYLNLLNILRTGGYLPDQIIYSALGYINTR
jgi:hypothetical protein